LNSLPCMHCISAQPLRRCPICGCMICQECYDNIESIYGMLVPNAGVEQ